MSTDIDFLPTVTQDERRLFEPLLRRDSLFAAWNDAVRNGDAEVLGIILKKTNLSGKDRSEGLATACRLGHTALVRIFLADSKTDPRFLENSAVQNAAENGFLDIVNLLLSDPRVNPGDDNNRALYLASRSGQTAVVERLLRDSRVDATDSDSRALSIAVRNKHFSVVERLLQVKEIADQPIVLQRIFGSTNIARIISTVKDLNSTKN